MLAGYYAMLGDRDHALVWLEKAYTDRDFRLTQIKVLFEFDFLHDDPRFIDLAKRVGIP
jgi:hypothetical protein